MCVCRVTGRDGESVADASGAVTEAAWRTAEGDATTDRRWLLIKHSPVYTTHVDTVDLYKLPDLESRIAYQRPRPRPRLWCPRPRPRLKTYKTNTGSLWLVWTVTNKKTEKVMASRKSSILVLAHSKQQNIISCLTTVLFPQLPLIIAVYQTLARTHNISKVRCLIDN